MIKVMSWVKKKGIRKEDGFQLVLTIFTEVFYVACGLVTGVYFTL